MKKILLFFLLPVAVEVSAQQFVNGFQLGLPDSISNPKVEWVDFDNDGLLDVLLIANVNTNVYMMTFKSDTTQGFLYQTAVNTYYQSVSFVLADYDLDNDVDILLSGPLSGSPKTTAWLNQNDFTFLAEHMIDKDGQVVLLSDLDSNGANELILGGDSLRMYRRSGAVWSLIQDSINVQATSVLSFDIDGDFDNDLFVSGRDNTGQPVSQAYFNEGGYSFRATSTPPSIAGSLSMGDLNHDGDFDIVVSGRNASNNSLSRLLLNRRNSFTVKDSVSQLVDATIFPADFNSDGKCDLHFYGKDSNGNGVNKISFSGSGEELLPTINVVAQRFGDFDKDGDLDIIQIIQGTSTFELIHIENTIEDENKGPGIPVDPVGFQLYDRAYVYWGESTDDHTTTASLTYDLTLQTSLQEQVIGSFDLINNKRLTVSHGNNGTRNFALIKNFSGGLQFIVQAIDNSFHASSSGVCSGTPLCSEVVPEVIKVCKKQNVVLTADAGSMWFSFRDGLIARGPSIEMEVNAGDSIFAFTPVASSGCARVKLFSVEIGTGIIETINTTQYACKDQVLTLEAEPSWTGVTWSSTKQGFLSNSFSIEYQVTHADTVKAILSDGTGCMVQRNTAIVISKPDLQLNGEVFQILRGQSVQLSATGGETYAWSPPTGLDNPQSSQPIASPFNTTSYQVTAADSIGCAAEGTVMVMVEGSAFVPNLFTPNNDGRNDEVRIYGLADVRNFRFTIHNREGNTVYETNDIQQAATIGWNGSARGSQQPSGVYYWKVRGEQPSGGKLLLNGKTNGTIVLIR
jgi:gliding motility-associated-like protein